ncbi:alpha/beta fold hydrolase [Bacillus thuringiensis]
MTVEPYVIIYTKDLNPCINKTILFIHGWPLNYKQVEYQLNITPTMGYRCIGIDWRGYVNSDKPSWEERDKFHQLLIQFIGQYENFNNS